MGRTLKRVPLDFAWPLQKAWEGYLNPWYKHCCQCNACKGTGYGPEAKVFLDQWYGYVPFNPASMGSEPFGTKEPAIVALAQRNIGSGGEAALFREINRLRRHFNAAWAHHLSQADVDALWAEGRINGFTDKPTAAQVNTAYLGGLGHDSLNCHYCIKARCEREGAEECCPVCHGSGSVWSDPEAEQKADAWEATEPPTGEGWQMWETVSEGSPISPVFDTPEKLARWLADCRESQASYGEWLGMITGDGWAPSGIGIDGTYASGVVGLHRIQESEQAEGA